ncbi:hypothetical protein BH20ACT5_BH20ACT5_24540 [soil metagenome]
MKSKLWTRSVLLTAVAGLTLTVAACGSDADDVADDAGDAVGDVTENEEETTEAEETEEETDDADAAGGEFGEGCAAVPADGDGSFESMSVEPVGTAASTNPVLETTVAALTAADLVDTLNGLPEATVFAPANDAYGAFSEEELNGLLADVPTLSSVLTYHVLPMRLGPDELAGTFETVNGAELTIEGSGEDFTVSESGAAVICGNVQTANATVYIIDQVLMPPAA